MTRITKKTCLLLLPLLAVLLFIAPRALAASYTIDGTPGQNWTDFGGGSGITLGANDTLTISAASSPADTLDFVITVAGNGVTITGSSTAYDSVRIVVNAGVETLTLNTLDITAQYGQNPGKNALTVDSNKLDLICVGTVSLKGGEWAV